MASVIRNALALAALRQQKHVPAALEQIYQDICLWRKTSFVAQKLNPHLILKKNVSLPAQQRLRLQQLHHQLQLQLVDKDKLRIKLC